MLCLSGSPFGLWKTKKCKVSNMDFTILTVILLIGVGIPVRNKLIRKYRDGKKQNDNDQDAKWWGEKVEWIRCPICSNKIWDKIQKILFWTTSLYYPISKNVCFIHAKQSHIIDDHSVSFADVDAITLKSFHCDIGFFILKMIQKVTVEHVLWYYDGYHGNKFCVFTF